MIAWWPMTALQSRGQEGPFVLFSLARPEFVETGDLPPVRPGGETAFRDLF